MKVIIAIVVYNKKINDSISYKTIKDQNYDELIIFDNSSSVFNQDKSSVTYLSLGYNAGLSKAYNYIINYVKNIKYDYIVLFDDDSMIEEDYIYKLKNSSLSGVNFSKVYGFDNKILAPDYHNENQLKEYIIRKNKWMFKNMQWYYDSSYSINSGMIIKSDVFNAYNYDENLFVDCVDYKFIRDYDGKIGISDCKIVQDFHSAKMDIKNFESLQKRLDIRLKDIKYYAPNKFLINKFFIVMLYSIKTKSFKFVKHNYKGG